MSKVEFKEFVKKNPNLINFVEKVKQVGKSYMNFMIYMERKKKFGKNIKFKIIKRLWIQKNQVVLKTY